MARSFREQVCDANIDMVRRGLVVETWGNASALDRDRGRVVIKPSGVDYRSLKPSRMVVVDLETGEVIEGRLRPSSDTPTHLVLYRAFPELGGIVHTHSLHATAWAQSRREIPPLGTTHADYWRGPVPCTRALTSAEIATDYEVNTGRVIVERFSALDPMEVRAVLVASHGPFAWGRSVAEAVECAATLEFVARLASESMRLGPDLKPIPQALLDKHFLRKHGPRAYYGQTSTQDVLNRRISTP
jgi:L-ribulose-5-phosphate 4-epimerase